LLLFLYQQKIVVTNTAVRKRHRITLLRANGVDENVGVRRTGPGNTVLRFCTVADADFVNATGTTVIIFSSAYNTAFHSVAVVVAQNSDGCFLQGKLFVKLLFHCLFIILKVKKIHIR
jgi:hypothetical protein